MVVRKEIIDKIGMFDENIFSYFEEYDWCKQAIEAGFKIKYYKEPIVIHHSAKSVVQEYPKMTYIWHQSRFYFFRKHYGLFSNLFLKMITYAGIVVRLIKYKKEILKNFDYLFI